jgi:hypothetical protein
MKYDTEKYPNIARVEECWPAICASYTDLLAMMEVHNIVGCLDYLEAFCCEHGFGARFLMQRRDRLIQHLSLFHLDPDKYKGNLNTYIGCPTWREAILEKLDQLKHPNKKLQLDILEVIAEGYFKNQNADDVDKMRKKLDDLFGMSEEENHHDLGVIVPVDLHGGGCHNN